MTPVTSRKHYNGGSGDVISSKLVLKSVLLFSFIQPELVNLSPKENTLQMLRVSFCTFKIYVPHVILFLRALRDIKLLR